MADAGDDDVVGPRVHVLARLAGQDPDRRAARALRAPRGRCHHLAPPAGDDGGAALGQQPADLFRALLVLGAAADDGDLDACHWWGC